MIWKRPGAPARVVFERFPECRAKKRSTPRQRIAPVGAQKRQIDLVDHGHGHLPRAWRRKSSVLSAKCQ